MHSRTYLFCLVFLAGLVSVCFGQGAEVLPDESALASNKIETPAFPYVAEITTDNVNIRSGPGTNYYSCGKLNKGSRVKVVASKYSWSHIVPPAGSFSWISKQYVTIDVNNPGTGIVTGNGVRVWAGSDHVKPIHSETLQGKLNKGDKVMLLGEEKDEYYKIAPPGFAYLWVSTEFARPVGPAEAQVDTAEPVEEPGSAVVVAAKTSIEGEKLKEFYALQKQIKAEQKKELFEQNYTTIRESLSRIAAMKEAGKASRYSEFALKQVDRYELAMMVAKEVKLQNTQFKEIRNRIDKARVKRLGKRVDLGIFAVVGILEISEIYGTEGRKRYRVTDEAGTNLCYAAPMGSAVRIDLSKLSGQKVGLTGTIEANPQTSGALVRFTDITKLE